MIFRQFVSRLSPVFSRATLRPASRFLSTYNGKGRRVLVCLDEKDHSEVFDWAQENILHTDDQIHFMHVFEPVEMEFIGSSIDANDTEMKAELEAVVKKTFEARAEVVAQRFIDGGFNAKVVVKKGAPAEEICNYAKTENADIVLVPKRGHIGPVAEAVLDKCQSPVFVYPERDPLEDSIFRKKAKRTVRFPL